MNGREGQPSNHAPDDAPDMSLIRRAVAPAPVLDLDPFGPLAEWIKRAAEAKSAPVDYVALAVLAAAAGCVGAARWASPWLGWSEPAILWTLLVGSPSAGKSPGMDAVREPLAEVEREIAASWPETQREHEAAATIAKARREAWEDATRAAVKASREPLARPIEADEPGAPQMPRIVVTDATIEAVATIAGGNPRGLLLWRDEASAWLANLSKYGDGDRAFWLEGYGGRPYTVDRRKLAEPLRIEHLALSIAAGIQPDRYAALLMAGDDDGLAARFLVCWPEAVPPRRPRHAADPAPLARALQRLRALPFRADATGEPRPVTLPIEDAALDVFQRWREQHHTAALGASGLMASALGKAPGQALRLALVIELLRWACGPDREPELGRVSADSLGAALDWFDSYFRPMLARVLGEATMPPADRGAAVLAQAIRERRATSINRREVRRSWSLPGLRDTSRLTAAIAVLEEARWLVKVGGRDGGSAGRERTDYAVDPRVHRVALS
jgi:hypothetical protein